MNFAGSIVDNFIMHDFYTHKSFFRPLYATKRDNLTPKTGYLLTCTVMI